MNDCVFCNIVNRSVNAEFLYEDDEIAVIKDIMPKAPVHLLIFPKKHVPTVNDFQPADAELIGKMVLRAREQAEKDKIDGTGYKLVFNVGKHGGQVISHVHLHLLGGKQLPE